MLTGLFGSSGSGKQIVGFFLRNGNRTGTFLFAGIFLFREIKNAGHAHLYLDYYDEKRKRCQYLSRYLVMERTATGNFLSFSKFCVGLDSLNRKLRI